MNTTGQHIDTCHPVGDILTVVIDQLTVRSLHTPSEGDLDGDMTIAAVPSFYGGTTFRSKLEADWAATLDSFGIAWEYEPETITLPSGATYLPDFHLPAIGTWIEVKGPGVPRVEKARELAQTRACRCPGRCSCAWPGGELVLIGHVPAPLEIADPGRYWSDYWERRRHANARMRTPGHPAWTAAHGRRAYLVTCRGCAATCWTQGQGWAGCRVCRAPYAGAHLYASAAPELLFVDSAARPRPGRGVGWAA